jgi:hypothetical protein
MKGSLAMQRWKEKCFAKAELRLQSTNPSIYVELIAKLLGADEEPK